MSRFFNRASNDWNNSVSPNFAGDVWGDHDDISGASSTNGGVGVLAAIQSGEIPAPLVAALSSRTAQSTTSLPYSTFKATSGTTTTSSGAKWGGISFSSTEGYYYPPDNALGVNNAASGSQTVVTAENNAVRIDKFSGGAISSSTMSGENSLFGSPASGFFYTDPRVIFDAQAGKFIITADEVNPNTGKSYFVYAVSSTAAPTSFTSGWTVHSISTTFNGALWTDQPLVSLNNGSLYVTTNMYDTAGNYQGDNLTVISNYATTPSAITVSSLSGPSYQPATIEDGSSAIQYFVSHNGANLDIIDSSGAVVATIGGMPAESQFAATQKGSTYMLDAGDGRVTSAVYDASHNLLYAVFEAAGSSSSPTDKLVQYNLSTGAVDTVNLNDLLPSSGSTSGAGTFNASLAVDAQGDLLVNFNASGPNMYAADYYAVWKASSGVAPTPTANNYSSLYDYQNSVAAYVDPRKDLIGRWGDYSSAIANPSVQNGFYISNEYDNGSTRVLFANYNSWGTVIASVNV
ncbi:hypothetical protein QM467_13665 [Rhodoblastus sp. 17X3]|uniref:hypothetical protein n=1 Tax=Rhodoblastus sp. 17X3 TaxID=3047026 RepID=UPI0024B75719|nr:hypothetical protein [Rhodoblastus sp. 17X3]MDI9849103.1 hypothetical protein [Rhodoblastus sp. 17X3]